jgi:repressor LexA
MDYYIYICWEFNLLTIGERSYTIIFTEGIWAKTKELVAFNRRLGVTGSFLKALINFMNELTPKQKNLLDYLKDQIQTNGLPPSMSEMATALKLKSKNAVSKLLKALVSKGFVRTTGKARGIEVLDKAGEPVGRGLMSVPVIGRVTAGLPMLAEEQIEDWLSLPVDLVRGKKDVFLLKVQGDSMKDAGILNGDLVLVRQQKIVEPGNIVVALLEDEATVKRLVKNNGRYYLKAENKAYSNIYPENEWSIQGKVIGLIRKME